MKTISSFNRLLFLFILFIFLMIAARAYYFRSWHFVFLSWNLFLAWIPYYTSSQLKRYDSGWKLVSLLLTWLLFFPNALYIVTDLVHLREYSAAPLWYDTILAFSAAFTGLVMAFISLYRVEQILAQKINRLYLPFVIISILFLASFGVYLGRYLRWNSWDIISNPLALLDSVFQRVVFPFEHSGTWMFTVLLTGMYSFLFYTCRKLMTISSK